MCIYIPYFIIAFALLLLLCPIRVSRFYYRIHLTSADTCCEKKLRTK